MYIVVAELVGTSTRVS